MNGDTVTKQVNRISVTVIFSYNDGRADTVFSELVDEIQNGANGGCGLDTERKHPHRFGDFNHAHVDCYNEHKDVISTIQFGSMTRAVVMVLAAIQHNDGNAAARARQAMYFFARFRLVCFDVDNDLDFIRFNFNMSLHDCNLRDLVALFTALGAKSGGFEFVMAAIGEQFDKGPPAIDWDDAPLARYLHCGAEASYALLLEERGVNDAHNVGPLIVAHRTRCRTRMHHEKVREAGIAPADRPPLARVHCVLDYVLNGTPMDMAIAFPSLQSFAGTMDLPFFVAELLPRADARVGCFIAIAFGSAFSDERAVVLRGYAADSNTKKGRKRAKHAAAREMLNLHRLMKVLIRVL